MRWFLKEQILKEERYGIYILAGSVGVCRKRLYAFVLWHGLAGCGSDPAAIVLFLLQDGGAGRGLASREKYARLYRLPDAGIPHQYSAGVHDVFFPDRVCGGYFFLKRQDPAAKKERLLKFG